MQHRDHSIAVRATSSLGAFSTVVVHVVVADANDHAPVFQPESSNLTILVMENTAVGTIVGTLRAVDLDVGNNGALQFSSSTGSSTAIPFAVLRNGDVIVNGVVDRESNPSFTFNAAVRDLGTTSLSAVTPAIIHIVVLDANDNTPAINTTLNGGVISLRRNSAIFNPIHTLLASDADIDQNRVVSYRESNSTLEVFDINRIMGTVSMFRSLCL